MMRNTFQKKIVSNEAENHRRWLLNKTGIQSRHEWTIGCECVSMRKGKMYFEFREEKTLG